MLREEGARRLEGDGRLSKRSPTDLLPSPLSRALATVFGVGLFPGGPGTAASAVSLLPLPFLPAAWWPWAPLIGCALATLGCVLISRTMPEKDEGGDPGWFVLDETAGVWLAASVAGQTWEGMGLAFLLFRIFDIWKPSPIRTLERVGGGWGIVLDDLAAGVYALLLLFAWGTWGAS